jgi:hypothetical protein
MNPNSPLRENVHIPRDGEKLFGVNKYLQIFDAVTEASHTL